MAFFRRVFVLACAVGGVFGAFRLLEMWAKQSGGAAEFHLAPEAMPLLMIVGIAGALGGAFVGSFVFPARH